MMGRGTENDILTYIYSTPHGDYNTKMKNLSDKKKARIYEWEKERVRFRIVVNNTSQTDSNPASASREIITFYSDRNLKKPMELKNPKLKESQ